MNVTQALQAAIRADGRPFHEIGKVGGVDRGVLSRFLRNERTVTTATADAILRGLGLECRLVRRRKGVRRG